MRPNMYKSGAAKKSTRIKKATFTFMVSYSTTKCLMNLRTILLCFWVCLCSCIYALKSKKH